MPRSSPKPRSRPRRQGQSPHPLRLRRLRPPASVPGGRLMRRSGWPPPSSPSSGAWRPSPSRSATGRARRPSTMTPSFSWSWAEWPLDRRAWSGWPPGSGWRPDGCAVRASGPHALPTRWWRPPWPPESAPARSPRGWRPRSPGPGRLQTSPPGSWRTFARPSRPSPAASTPPHGWREGPPRPWPRDWVGNASAWRDWPRVSTPAPPPSPTPSPGRRAWSARSPTWPRPSFARPRPP